MILSRREPLAVFCLFVAACRHPAAHYDLRRDGAASILVPPGSASSLDVIPHARRKRATISCDVDNDLISLTWRGNNAIAKLRSRPLYEAEGQRVDVDSLHGVEALRSALYELEAKGCFTPAERVHLQIQIAETFALPPPFAYYLRFGPYLTSGSVDFTPDFRLKVISPIANGYATAIYKINPRPDTGVQVLLQSVTPEGPETGPIHDLLAKSTQLRDFRILLWTSRSSADHLATLLAAETRSSLDEATRRFGQNPDNFCSSPLPPGVACVVVTKDSAVNVEIRVLVNGRDEYLALGGSVRDALRAGKAKESVIPNLKVSRLYRGKPISLWFDPGKKDILDLVLLPGDQVTW